MPIRSGYTIEKSYQLDVTVQSLISGKGAGPIIAVGHIVTFVICYTPSLAPSVHSECLMTLPPSLARSQEIGRRQCLNLDPGLGDIAKADRTSTARLDKAW